MLTDYCALLTLTTKTFFKNAFQLSAQFRIKNIDLTRVLIGDINIGLNGIKNTIY